MGLFMIVFKHSKNVLSCSQNGLQQTSFLPSNFFKFSGNIKSASRGGGNQRGGKQRGRLPPPPLNHTNKIHIFLKHQKVGYLKYLRNEIDFYN